ncbi:MAG: sigma-70 family RNA polymerase sigma factor [Saprospiraceae bacterium]
MSDLEIWQNIKAGDRQSFSMAYDQNIDQLIRYGSRFTRDATLVEDCLHDLFVYIWQNREKLSDTDSIRNYLMVSLRRSIIRKVKEVSKSQGEINDHDNAFGTELSIEDILTKTEMDAEKATKMRIAFEKLSARQKEAIYLKYYNDMDYEGICEMLNISYQSARNLVSSGIKKLRDILAVVVMTIQWLTLG